VIERSANVAYGVGDHAEELGGGYRLAERKPAFTVLCAMMIQEFLQAHRTAVHPIEEIAARELRPTVRFYGELAEMKNRSRIVRHLFAKHGFLVVTLS
jgi:hypothetical protein